MRLVYLALMAGAASILWSWEARASGDLPPVPLPPTEFASYDACLNHLVAVQSTNQVGVADGAVSDGENATRQKFLETRGVIRSGADSAYYNAEVGFQFRVTDRKAGYIHTTYSYERTHLECAGKRLNGTFASGYMSDGFEALPDAQSSPP
jgi:hypothetical protein